MSHESRPPPSQPQHDLLEQLRATTALLEQIAGNVSVVDALPPAERERLFQAVARVHHPDHYERRNQRRAAARERRATHAREGEAVLHETGIRALRRKPVFTAPAFFPPLGFSPQDIPKLEDGGGSERPSAEPQTLLRLQGEVPAHPPLLRPAVPGLRRAQLQQAHRTADLRGRVALLTGGRVKIGYQAGLKLLRAGAHLIVTTRFPRDAAARYAAEADFGDWGHRLEIFGLDLRHTPSVEAFCHELAEHARAPRLHHQQRLPDRAPPAGLLRAPDGRRDRGAAPRAGSRAQTARRLRGPAQRPHPARGRRGERSSLPAAHGRSRRSALTALTRAAELSQVPLLPEELLAAAASVSRRAGSTRTCSRSTCAGATPGACCWPRCRRSSCSRCSSSTPSRRSSSTRGSSR